MLEILQCLHCVGEAALLSPRPTDNGSSTPQKSTPAYTRIHRLPNPWSQLSWESERALNKQIKGRLTIVGPSNRRPTDKRGFDSLLLRHLPKENEERGIPGSLLHGEKLSSNINSVSVKINIDGLWQTDSNLWATWNPSLEEPPIHVRCFLHIALSSVFSISFNEHYISSVFKKIIVFHILCFFTILYCVYCQHYLQFNHNYLQYSRRCTMISIQEYLIMNTRALYSTVCSVCAL